MGGGGLRCMECTFKGAIKSPYHISKTTFLEVGTMWKRYFCIDIVDLLDTIIELCCPIR